MSVLVDERKILGRDLTVLSLRIGLSQLMLV